MPESIAGSALQPLRAFGPSSLRPCMPTCPTKNILFYTIARRQCFVHLTGAASRSYRFALTFLICRRVSDCKIESYIKTKNLAPDFLKQKLKDFCRAEN